MAVSERILEASPDLVFKSLIDAESYPQWLVGSKFVSVRDPRWPRPGSSFDHESGIGPLDVHDSTTVAGIVPGHTLDLIVRARPFLEADVHFDVIASGSGTLLRMGETPRGFFRVLAPLVAPLVRARNNRSLSRLAARLDGEHDGRVGT